jgi:HTH-type transcriptional regulator/antitoxin HipB
MLIHSAQELAVVVRDQRKKLKLSQSEAGDLVGLKQATVSAFENKPDSTKLETLFRLLAALNLEVIINVRGNVTADLAQWKEEW